MRDQVNSVQREQGQGMPVYSDKYSQSSEEILQDSVVFFEYLSQTLLMMFVSQCEDQPELQPHIRDHIKHPCLSSQHEECWSLIV